MLIDSILFSLFLSTTTLFELIIDVGFILYLADIYLQPFINTQSTATDSSYSQLDKIDYFRFP